MRIDLDDLEECRNCGVIFNFQNIGKYKDKYTTYKTGNCPVCKEEFCIER